MIPFRTQPKPSVRSFLAAAALWATLALCTILTLHFNHSLKNGFSWQSAWQQLLPVHWIPVISISALCGSLLGGIHYILTRACCRKKQRPVRFSEIGMVLCAIAVLSGYPGYRVARIFIEGQISQVCWQYEVSGEIESLVAQGKHAQAVRRMEESCKIYQDVLKKGIPDHLKSFTRRYGGNGNGYFLCTLGSAWETLALNMPYGLRYYLDGGPSLGGYSSGGALDQAERWKPLGTEMAASTTPIIRVLGYWLLEDRERFACEVYRQYDSGDQSFRALNDLVCFQYDPKPRRAIHRLLTFKPRVDRDEGNFIFYEEEDRIGRIYYLTLVIVKTGDEFGDDAAAVRPILRQFSETPNFKESQYNRWFVLSFCGNLQSCLDKGDMDSALRLMEIACHNLHDSRKKLGDDFSLLARIRDDEYRYFQGFLSPLIAARESFELNIPFSLVWFISSKTNNVHEEYFNKSLPDTYQYRTYNEASIFREPEKMSRLAEKMTESSTPILRALGYYLKGDRPQFISTVYQTHDSGDSSFDSLHRLVSEKMDNHGAPAKSLRIDQAK